MIAQQSISIVAVISMADNAVHFTIDIVVSVTAVFVVVFVVVVVVGGGGGGGGVADGVSGMPSRTTSAL